MTRIGGVGVPGVGSADFTSEKEVYWGGDDAKGRAIWFGANISNLTRDAGNSPTTVLRPGLVLGMTSVANNYVDWNPENAALQSASVNPDGKDFAGILTRDIMMTDFSGNSADRVLGICVRGPVKASALLIQGSPMVGHKYEYLLRRQLYNSGYILDDDPQGYKGGGGNRFLQNTAATFSLTAAMNGATLIQAGVAGTVTLPPIQAGLEYDLINTIDSTFVVASAEGDNIILVNDLSADSITFSTTSMKIGARIKFRCILVGATTLKWLPEIVPTPFTGTATSGTPSYTTAT